MTEAKRKEKINELMNKISLSLKDANLQQGFEIICNRISELEKENEELKVQIEVLKETHKQSLNIVCEQLEEKDELINKMKCCSNCKHKFEPRKKGSYVMPCEATEYKPCDKWELAE